MAVSSRISVSKFRSIKSKNKPSRNAASVNCISWIANSSNAAIITAKPPANTSKRSGFKPFNLAFLVLPASTMHLASSRMWVNVMPCSANFSSAMTLAMAFAVPDVPNVMSQPCRL